MVVYLVRAGDGFEKIILPVHGRGLFSMLYGFLALEADLSTVSEAFAEDAKPDMAHVMRTSPVVRQSARLFAV